MKPIEIIAQILGLFGLAMNVLSFQQKTKRSLITVQFIGGAIFAIHFLLLKTPIGCMLNLISVFRGIVFSNKEKFKADNILWLPAFFSLFAASYVLSFVLFGKEPSAYNLIVGVLPVCGMVISTISFRTKNAATVRKLSLFNSPLWLVYDALEKSIGGTLCEVMCLISIVVGIIRLDLKKAPKNVS